jgi:hypothetical protein
MKLKKHIAIAAALAASAAGALYASTGEAWAPALPFTWGFNNPVVSVGFRDFYATTDLTYPGVAGVMASVAGAKNPNNGKRVVVANLKSTNFLCAPGQTRGARIYGVNEVGLPEETDCWADDLTADGVTYANGNQNTACMGTKPFNGTNTWKSRYHVAELICR